MSQERVCFRPNTHLIGEGSPIDAGRRHPRRRYRRRRRRRRSVGVAVGVVLRLLRRQAARQPDAQLGNVTGDFFGAAAADHEIGDGTRRQRHGTARPRRRRHLKFMKKNGSNGSCGKKIGPEMIKLWSKIVFQTFQFRQKRISSI